MSGVYPLTWMVNVVPQQHGPAEPSWLSMEIHDAQALKVLDARGFPYATAAEWALT